MKEEISIHWFRQDLRLNDNTSLNYLSKNNHKIVCIFIYDEINCEKNFGEAGKVWLHQSLDYLNKKLGNRLVFFRGNPIDIFSKILDIYNVKEICWNRCYEPWRIKRDSRIKESLKKKVKIKTFNASLLWEPWEILKNDGSPYKIFTPFYKRGCLNHSPPRKPYSEKISFFNHSLKSLDLNQLGLLNNRIWENNLVKDWKIGESYAYDLMNSFFLDGVHEYSEGRNYPNKKNVSRLSPYLHWGQISVNTLWYEVEKSKWDVGKENMEIFKSELGWREFFYNLMYHFPEIQSKNLQKKFDNFPWQTNTKFLDLWKKGLTGFPIVDAGMRELWDTGYMHNRVRMITGSFLVKNLLLHWHNGEKWFWDCLFDADYASNSASWQWVAGTGTDSTPYFRIFNPVTQGKKFDPTGDYIKRFIPELRKVPIKYLFEPWLCPENISEEIGFKIGRDYPKPVVDVKDSRQKALEAFSSLKNVNYEK